MAITAAAVKELREKTGLGMMLCKKALTEADGDMEKAIENLRKQGQATMAKRAGKAAKEGAISISMNDTTAVMYEVNSETDFVARNDDFVSFSDTLGELLLGNLPADINAANELTSEAFGGQTVASKLLELTGKIGEKISLRRFAILKSDSNQKIATYIHNKKIGVMVTITCDKQEVLGSEAIVTLGKDIAMQIAASNPVAAGRDGVPSDVVAKEKEIYLTQAQSSGKPEKIWDKIVEGKLSKFFKQIVLLEQDFIRDPDITVTDRINQTAKELDASLSIAAYERFELGSESEE